MFDRELNNVSRERDWNLVSKWHCQMNQSHASWTCARDDDPVKYDNGFSSVEYYSVALEVLHEESDASNDVMSEFELCIKYVV